MKNKVQDYARVPTRCALPKIQVMQPAQPPKEALLQQSVETKNISQAKKMRYYEPRLEKKRAPKPGWSAVHHGEATVHRLEGLIHHQIEEELAAEFERQRALPENLGESDKQLWANVMVDHVQRVRAVLLHLRS